MTQNPSGQTAPETQAAQAVLARLHDAPSISSIGAVLATMQGLDSVLPSSDGVKWFNLLYLFVTQTIHQTASVRIWGDASGVTRLDMTFAQFNVDALAHSSIDPASVPQAWAALFESR